MTDFEYRKTLITGAIIGLSVMLLVIYLVKPSISPNPPISTNAENHRNFERVDTYKGCDVVQWDDGNLATYKYFLHCNNTRPVYEN